MVICRFSIDDISEEELTAKDALLLWCKKKTRGYEGVGVENFHTSWKDGLAFCALIHAHRPDLLNYDSLNKNDPAGNLQLAFDVAEKQLGLPALLDVADIVDSVKPDERSIMTYVAQFYHLFSSNKKQEVAGRRVGKLVDLTSQIEQMKQDYEDFASKFVEWAKQKQPAFADRASDDTLEDFQSKQSDMTTYKGDEKLVKAAEKVQIEGLFNAIALKLRSNNRPPYTPPEGQGLADVESWWSKVGDEEKKRNDWISAELARHQKLQQLLNRFNQKAAALEAWIASKTEYLNVNEVVETLLQAQSKLKIAESFTSEYDGSKKRLQQVQELGAEIVTLYGENPKGDEVKNRVASINGSWDGLAGLHQNKINDLKEKLAKQEKMEALRHSWAKKAEEYLFWTQGVQTANGARNFGDSIDAVEAFVKVLDQSEADDSKNSEEQKTALEALWKEMEEVGIKDNKYTSITIQDVASFHQTNVLDSAKARRDAYNAELERQRLLEEKRKEFAQKAQEFVDHIAARRSGLDALNVEPDPSVLIGKVKETYQDGAPDQKALESVQALANELGRLGVRDNKHTTLTVPILQSQSDKLSNHVKNLIVALQEELEAKEDYNARAKALLDWIEATIPTLKKIFDNTLEGARKANAEWNSYKSGIATEKGVEKSALHTLYDSIIERLKSNNRPAEFTPTQGLALADIDAAWDRLAASEKEVHAEVKAELSRQEKLARLVRQFKSDASDLQAFIESAKVALTAQEDVASLNSARLYVRLLQLKREEIEANKSELDAIQALKAQIAELNYHDIDTVNLEADALAAAFAELATLADAKAAALTESTKTQEEKEALRVAFGKAAQKYSRFVRDSAEHAGDKNFGTSLESVSAFKSTLDSEEADANAKATELRAEVDGVWKQIEASGVDSPYAHSRIEIKDVDSLGNSLTDALAQRRAAYDAELAKQQANDAKAKEYADKANAFDAFLAGEKEQIVKVSGAPEAKIAAINDIHKDGAEANEQLAALGTASAELESLGVYSNPHTTLSLATLAGKNAQQEAFIKNTISALSEEQSRNDRAAAQKAELEAREKVESLQIDFNLKNQTLSAFINDADDIHADPTKTKSIAEVEELQASYNKFAEQIPEQQKAHDELVTLAATLKEQGVDTTIDDVTTRWNATVQASESRKSDLAAEHDRQQANDALAKEYADEANAFKTWLDSENQSVANLAGELEEQITKLSGVLAGLEAGNAKLEALSATYQKVVAADITSNPYTEHEPQGLQAEFKETADALRKRLQLLEKDAVMKKMGDVTPEQLEEFRTIFVHFDKSKKGSLTALEFKGALQSLGEELNEEQVKALVAQLDQDGDGKIGFDEFVTFMKSRAADTDSSEQILESFKVLAGDKDFVTEEDLRRSGMEKEKVDYLIKNMPKNDNGFEYTAWVAKAYGN
jgi:actinin alpha